MAVLFWLCQTKPVSKVPIWTINTGEAYKFDDLLRVLPCLSDHVGWVTLMSPGCRQVYVDVGRVPTAYLRWDSHYILALEWGLHVIFSLLKTCT